MGKQGEDGMLTGEGSTVIWKLIITVLFTVITVKILWYYCEVVKSDGSTMVWGKLTVITAIAKY